MNTPVKRCTRCGRDLPLTAFHVRKASRDGLMAACKTCIGIYTKHHYAENKAADNERSRQYRETHRDEVCRRLRAYYRKNREKIIKRVGEWRKSNPDKLHKNSRAYVPRRRARRKSLLATFTTTDWQRALDYFNGCCAVCGRPQGLWHTIAADHWIPLSSPDCPGTIPTNVVPLCHAKKDVPSGTPCCNNSKHKCDPIEWLTKTYGKQKARQILKRIETYFQWVAEQDTDHD